MAFDPPSIHFTIGEYLILGVFVAGSLAWSLAAALFLVWALS